MHSILNPFCPDTEKLLPSDHQSYIQKAYTHSGDEGFFKVYMVSIPLLCFKKSSNNKQNILFSEASHVSRTRGEKIVSGSTNARRLEERKLWNSYSKSWSKFAHYFEFDLYNFSFKKSNLYTTRNTKIHVKVLLSLFFLKNGKTVRFHSQNINLKLHIASVYNLLQR